MSSSQSRKAPVRNNFPSHRGASPASNPAANGFSCFESTRLQFISPRGTDGPFTPSTACRSTFPMAASSWRSARSSASGIRRIALKEETAGRKGRPFGRARPMEISGSQTARICRRGGWWRAILAAETMMTSEFGREDARGSRGRGGRRRTGGLVRTSPLCSAHGWKRKRSAVRGGVRGDSHEVSILIRLGGGDRAVCAPWNVSTMIMQPRRREARLSHRRRDDHWGAQRTEAREAGPAHLAMFVPGLSS